MLANFDISAFAQKRDENPKKVDRYKKGHKKQLLKKKLQTQRVE